MALLRQRTANGTFALSRPITDRQRAKQSKAKERKGKERKGKERKLTVLAIRVGLTGV